MFAFTTKSLSVSSQADSLQSSALPPGHFSVRVPAEHPLQLWKRSALAASLCPAEKMHSGDHSSALSTGTLALKGQISSWASLHALCTQDIFLAPVCSLSLIPAMHQLHPWAQPFQHIPGGFSPAEGWHFAILAPSSCVSTYEVSPSVCTHAQREFSSGCSIHIH